MLTMTIRLVECFIFVGLFLSPVVSLNQRQKLQNDSKIEITSEMLNLYKTSEIVRSDKIKYEKVEQKKCDRCTMMRRSIDRILPRRKRYLIYPSASNVVVTLSLVKALTFSTPRGYNFLGEVDFFYPLPDKIYVPHHRTTTTEAPPPTTTAAEVFDHHHSDFHDHFPTGWDHDPSNEIFMPDGGWQGDIFQNINAVDDSSNADMDVANSSRRYWTENLSYRNAYNNLKPPPFVSSSRRRFDFLNPPQPKSPAYYRKQRSTENIADDDIKSKDHSDGPHYKAHIDRRDLYNNIEAIFESKGIQFKSCILRAICEAKHFLLPKGKSLFHDIFRILFTIPTRNEMDDVYSNAVRNHDDSENCWRLYENGCPISILELMLKSQKIL